MEVQYHIYDSIGKQINTILADEEFVEQYCKENSYTFQLVDPPPPPSDPMADLDAMAVDHEIRITLLELGVM